MLSPATESKDREIKLPIYAHYGVAYAWLVDPRRRTLEAYALQGGQSQCVARAEDQAVVSAPPFDALRLELIFLEKIKGFGDIFITK